MNVKHGSGSSGYGPGVLVELTGDEVATAIGNHLAARGVHVVGPRTVRVNDELCEEGSVYVDPSGYVEADGQRYSGRGITTPTAETVQKLVEAHALAVAAYTKNVEAPTDEVIKAFADASAALVAALTGGGK